jgi:hypothetical protein
MRNRLSLVLCAVAVACSGCAAENVVTHINSEPPGARIEVNDNAVGNTPCDVTLPQQGGHHRLQKTVYVNAYPADGAQGQFKQQQFLPSDQEAPANIIFIMAVPPPPPNPGP